MPNVQGDRSADGLGRTGFLAAGFLAAGALVGFVQGLGQGVPGQSGALYTHRELDHSLERFQVAQGHTFGRCHLGPAALVFVRPRRSCAPGGRSIALPVQRSVAAALEICGLDSVTVT